ncbi:MAG: methyltransferase domain-containing protein [Kofleriaceae bacterium]
MTDPSETIDEHDRRTRAARRASFDRNAALYDAVRPGYPERLVDAVIARAPGPRLLELGAGTGKATRVFARRDVAITALEPGPELAALLRHHVAGRDVSVRETEFERFDERGFDLVYAAQAFHWMDPETRCHRAAAAGQVLAILTNEKQPLDPDLRAELDAAYDEHFPLAWLRGSEDPVEATRALWTGELAASGCFGPIETLTEAWRERYPTERYIELLSTYSDHAVQEDPRRLYDAIRAAIDRRGGVIEIPYLTMAFVATALG